MQRFAEMRYFDTSGRTAIMLLFGDKKGGGGREGFRPVDSKKFNFTDQNGDYSPSVECPNNEICLSCAF